MREKLSYLKLVPGPDLLAAIRAGLIRRHSSLAAWCRNHGISPAWANQALTGRRNGPSATRLRERLAVAAGIRPQPEDPE